jgi:hypothetical protein
MVPVVVSGFIGLRRPIRVLEPQDFGPTDDTAEGEEPLGHRHLNRLHETLATNDAVGAGICRHRRFCIYTDHTLEMSKIRDFDDEGIYKSYSEKCTQIV